MTHGAIIVFELSLRLCGALVTQSCHMERVADFSSEAVCRAAGRIMLIYPGVSGFKCKLETREFPTLHIGNPYNSGNLY
jgi:hypothetical protein